MAPQRFDQVGHRVGRLLVERYIGRDSGYLCRCDCGAVTTVLAGNLRRWITKSCGCLKRSSVNKITSLVHGESKRRAKRPTTEYSIWGGIIQRCENLSAPAYRLYGGRGIKICAAWRESFTAFLRDVGRRPSINHSIDRYPDPDGHYEPGNIRWATPLQQRHNRSQNL